MKYYTTISGSIVSGLEKYVVKQNETKDVFLISFEDHDLDDIINILEDVNKTGSSNVVEKNKHLFLGKYEAIPKLLSSILSKSDQQGESVSVQQIEAVEEEFRKEIDEVRTALEENQLMVDSSNDGLW